MGTHGRYPLHDGFLLMWSLSLNDGVGLSPFVAIDDVVVEGKVFL